MQLMQHQFIEKLLTLAGVNKMSSLLIALLMIKVIVFLRIRVCILLFCNTNLLQMNGVSIIFLVAYPIYSGRICHCSQGMIFLSFVYCCQKLQTIIIQADRYNLYFHLLQG